MKRTKKTIALANPWPRLALARTLSLTLVCLLALAAAFKLVLTLSTTQ